MTSLAAGALMVLAVAAMLALRRRSRRHGRASLQVRRISVTDGYEPSEVHVQADRPVRMLFRREVTAESAEYVVFADFGISAMLPPHQEVPVDLPPCPPGEHVFTCRLDEFRGRLLVDSPSNRKARS